MKKEKKIKFEIFWNTIFLLSAMCFHLLITLKMTSHMSIMIVFDEIVLGLVIGYLLFYKHFVSKMISWSPIFGEKIDHVISLFLGIETSKVVIRYFGYYDSFLKNMMFKTANLLNMGFDSIWIVGRIVLFIAAIPFLYILWMTFLHYCVPKVLEFFKGLSKIEKRYMAIVSCIMILLITLVQTQTRAFTFPIPKGEVNPVIYDVLYTTDTGVQINSDSFENFAAPENDLRQPLFAVFSFPFGLAANIGAEMFEILPRNVSYSFFIVCLQGFVLVICSILLVRMMGKKDDIFALVMYSAMYATIFFTLNIEQYVFGIFWLIVLLYNFIKKKEANPFLFCAATGSLITNAVLLPFLIFQKDWKKFIKECIKYGMLLCFLIVLFGQTSNVLEGILNFGKYESAMGMNVTFYNRILQYINFIASCFIAPQAFISTTHYDHVSYQLLPSTSVNIVGLVLLIGMIISFILNYKNKIVQFSFGWLLFSFVILCIIGWGTAENGLIIYGIYFSWAYFILIYLLLDGILKKVPKMKPLLMCVLILIMIGLNSVELLKIIDFGRTYYPFQI